MMHQRQRWFAPSSLTGARQLVQRLVCAMLALALATSLVRAHEVPQRVAIRGFVQQDGTTLRLLLRVPLEAMRDVDFPLRDDGSLDLVRVRTLLPEAAQVWLVNAITITADGRALPAPRITGTRLALPLDRAFEQLATARAAFTRPPLESEVIQWQQVLFDVALEYTLPSPTATLVLRPDLATLGIRTTSVLHVVDTEGRQRTLTYDGNPGAVALDPAWYQTAAQFVRTGFSHILGGFDHLLFVLCLVLPVRGWRALITLVTAFTLAHSLTLAAAALGVTPGALWFPPLVEVLIAASIVWLAIENVVLPGERLTTRWPVAFGFGLVHGFGFSFALADTLQFAGGNLVSALLAFNVGVELGQLAVLAIALPMLWMLRRWAGAGRERLVTIVGSVLVAHSAWHWMVERGEALAAHRAALAWPTLDARFALGLMQAALLLAVALAVALAMRQILRVPRRS
ncbi:MAG: HupE/UreJ family protein [Gemmatimonadota bacterium]